METRGATSAHHRRPAVERRFKSECTLRRGCFRLNQISTAYPEFRVRPNTDARAGERLDLAQCLGRCSSHHGLI
jgi:hypothetical protein